MVILLKVIYRVNATPLKTPTIFFTEIIFKNPKIHMDSEKTYDSQGYPKQKEHSWRHHYTRLQAILESHSNNNLILVQKQTCTPVK